MVERKAPLINFAAAAGNLLEGLFWTGAYFQMPTKDNLQSMVECGLIALENLIIFAVPYGAEKNTKVNSWGGLLNTTVGACSYLISYQIEHFPNYSDLSGTAALYPPRSVSRIFQPVVNMIGIGANALEAYNKKELAKS